MDVQMAPLICLTAVKNDRFEIEGFYDNQYKGELQCFYGEA